MNGIEFLLLLASAGGGVIAVIVAVRWGNQQTWRGELIAYTLAFPRGLDMTAVTAFVAGPVGPGGSPAHPAVRGAGGDVRDDGDEPGY